MFIIHWMFDKLGYMPKIDLEIGKVNIEATWPFPAVSKDFDPRPKKPTVKKPAVKKTTRKPKTK